MADDATGDGLEKKNETTLGFAVHNPNVFVLHIDLAAVPSATARGLLVEADDVLVQFYKAKAQELSRLRDPNIINSIKRGGAAFLSKFR